MNENITKLSSALKRVAISYLLIYFHINIGTLDILPDWAGYLLIISALPILAQREKSTLLLTSLGVVLALWEGVEWVLTLLGGSIELYVISVIVGILHMYFHFQLITNIAGFASEEKRKKRLLVLRAAEVVFHTATLVIIYIPDIQYGAFATGFAQLVVSIWICIELFSLASAVKKEEQKLTEQNEPQAFGTEPSAEENGKE